MRLFDLEVIDAGGFTFGFTYVADSASEARKLFYDKLRSLGKCTSKIKIKSVEDAGIASIRLHKGSIENQVSV